MGEIIKQIQPIKGINCRIRLPGSKSITHRALLMAALAEGKSVIKNPLKAEDTLLTAGALQQLGVEIDWDDRAERILVVPPKRRWSQPQGAILLGNSGTSMRLLLGLVATGTGKFILDGTPRLRERPIGPVLDALKEVGVNSRCLINQGFPPVELDSTGLKGGEAWVDATQSSQFLSALLIASPCAKSEMRVGWQQLVASFPYVRLTLAMMEQFGIEYRWITPRQIAIKAPQTYPQLDYQVEADCSSASYFWAAAALTRGEVLTYPLSPNSSQGDCRLLEVLQRMGCGIQWEQEGARVTGAGPLKAIDLDMNEMPDMVPTLAIIAACADGRSRIRNVAHLRVKESDRLHVIATELSKFGVPVEELPDGLVIEGGKVGPPQAPIESHNDHRIAMAFAILGLFVQGVEIRGAEAVGKSFPAFWEKLDRLMRTDGHGTRICAD